jgi:hypothetical protein
VLIAVFVLTNALLKRLVWNKPTGGVPSARPHRLARSRTPGFQPGNTGSNPVGAISSLVARIFLATEATETPEILSHGFGSPHSRGHASQEQALIIEVEILLTGAQPIFVV